jgi:hypothetical protein
MDRELFVLLDRFLRPGTDLDQNRVKLSAHAGAAGLRGQFDKSQSRKADSLRSFKLIHCKA